MPWRRKPASRLHYWSGGSPSRSKAAGFKTIHVYCMGRPAGPRCYHSAELRLDDLQEWDWYDICAHLKCTECGSVGWVDPRPNWSDVIDFNKGIGSRAPGARYSLKASMSLAMIGKRLYRL